MNIPDHLINEHYGDRYFDVVDAIAEAKHIHICGGRVVERLLAMPDGGRCVAIGETGFGAGRILVALMDSLEAGGVANAEIAYHSVELHPIAAGRMESILEGFKGRVGSHIRKLVDAYSGIDISTPGWHHTAIDGGFGRVALRLFIGEALDMVSSLDKPCAAWFLDGHAPSKNPDIWRPELLAAIGRKTEEGGTVTTFTAAGHVRRGLAAAGFAMERAEGCGGKKEVLRGVRGKNIS